MTFIQWQPRSILSKMLQPHQCHRIKVFPGMINFYGKFFPNLSSTLEPLHKLLRKRARWTWSTRQQEAYVAATTLLQSSQVLVHYDPEKPLVLSCDAYPYGVGAVLAHKLDACSERPIACASRTLSKAERGYSQLDKEALGVPFGDKNSTNSCMADTSQSTPITNHYSAY